VALASSFCGWYVLIGQMLTALDFPIELPVGDLSRFIKPAKKGDMVLDIEA
jgi:hypothetical protein